MEIRTDEKLVILCSQGDQAAFDFLFKKYARPLTNFIYQIVRDHNRAEDLLQDTFLSVFENAHRFNSKYKFSTWVYRIALNLSINELKRKSRDKERFYDTSGFDSSPDSGDFLERQSDYSDPEKLLVKKDSRDQIKIALNQLPAAKKIAFVLKFDHQLSYDEIANIMDSTIGTAKSRIHYAIEKLQEIVSI